MSTYQKCGPDIEAMARGIMEEFECYELLSAVKPKIDLVFAYGKRDDNGKLIGDALKKGGVKCAGLTRILSLKDRALGRGDAEICLDADWWEEATPAQQKALLDHELYHLSPSLKTDDLGRPGLKLRHHDFDFGWFRAIAERHGAASQECQQATILAETCGQLFWPSIVSPGKSSRFASIELSVHRPQS